MISAIRKKIRPTQNLSRPVIRGDEENKLSSTKVTGPLSPWQAKVLLFLEINFANVLALLWIASIAACLPIINDAFHPQNGSAGASRAAGP
ncbi:hypothetical protein, partial [Cerasicoccus arenae]|uniref:hypothetical protein n=1 Tax=Cerasicoccus arenae TaxID=424488 RepID=UPI001F42957D